MLHVLVPLTGGFRERYPDIELELHSSDQIIDLLEHRTDLALRHGSLRHSTFARPAIGPQSAASGLKPGLPGQTRHVPQQVEDLATHSLIGFTQPERLNHWPLHHPLGETWPIVPSVWPSSGETVRQLALVGEGIACLSDFMTARDRADVSRVGILAEAYVKVLQPIHGLLPQHLARRAHHLLSRLPERAPDRAGLDAARITGANDGESGLPKKVTGTPARTSHA